MLHPTECHLGQVRHKLEHPVVVKRTLPKLSNYITEGNMQSSWVSLQGTEQTFSPSLALATKNGNKQRQNGINRARMEVCLYCLTCSVLHLSTFTLDVLNLYYCVRLHYFSVWYHNLKSIFFCLRTWIVSLSGVRIQLMF